LLKWYASARRDLPWRASRDPYQIWVSEIMLQQTQVATVIPYFERFISEFPTVTDLAGAGLQRVLRAWEGLGYYRRARDLLAAAKLMVRLHGGQVPSDFASLRQLPGFGRYTAGAVLSQAFDQRLPIVEANSRRVICRLFGYGKNSQSGPGSRWLWQAAEALLPKRKPGDFNQALMELGALVCTNGTPDCGQCPVRRVCVARRLGLQEAIPLKVDKPQAQFIEEVAVVVRRGQRLLLVQRSKQGRWASMWEFPHTVLQDGEMHDQAALRLLNNELGLDCAIGPELVTLRHQVTHHRIRMVCLNAAYKRGQFHSARYSKGRWLETSRLGTLPVSAPQRRLVNYLSMPERQHSLF
jgi:A/G-specific adenine glycosylase